MTAPFLSTVKVVTRPAVLTDEVKRHVFRLHLAIPGGKPDTVEDVCAVGLDKDLKIAEQLAAAAKED